MVSKGCSLDAIKLEHGFNRRKIVIYTGLRDLVKDQEFQKCQCVV